MQRPVVDNFGILLLAVEQLTVDEQLDVREVHVDGVVMPLVVTHLRDLPAPLGRPEDVQVAFGKVAPQEKNETAVADEEGVVMSVHF